MTNLYVCTSPLHIVISILIASNKSEDENLIILTGQHKKRNAFFYELLSSWSQSPFKEIHLCKARSKKQIESTLGNITPNSIFIGNDLITEFFHFKSYAKVVGAGYYYMDDGLFSYFEYHKDLPNSFIHFVKNLARRVIKGYRKPFPHTLGSSPDTDGSYLLFPSLCKSSLNRKPKYPISIGDKERNLFTSLNEHVCKECKVEPSGQETGTTFLLIPHYERLSDNIIDELIIRAKEQAEMGHKLIVKNHPSNPDTLVKKIFDDLDVIYVPKEVPIEFLMLSSSSTVLIGGLTSAFITAKALNPNLSYQIIHSHQAEINRLTSKFYDSKVKNEVSLEFGFLLGSLTGAGAEKTILTLATTLAERGHYVSLYLMSDKADYDEPEGLQIYIAEGTTKYEKAKWLRERTKERYFDLFVCSRADFLPHVTSNNKYCSVHITPTAWLDTKNNRPWKRWEQMFRLKRRYKGKNLIALSEGIKRDLIANLSCEPNAIKVINNPFDLSHIHDLANQEWDRPNYDYIIYIASMIPRKRHKDLIHAFAKIKRKDIKLVLVGKGPLEQELKRLASSLGVLDRLIFWGWDSNPYRLLKGAKLSILASEAEGLPRVLVESLVVGTPIVSTDCPSGPNEVLINELSQFLVPVGDISKMTQSIDLALENYPEIPSQLLNRFDSHSVAAQYEQLALSHQ